MNPVDQQPLAIREKTYGVLVAAAFANTGLSVELAKGIVYHESAWRAGAAVLTGPDGAMGGAYGLFQMTFETSKDQGFKGLPDALMDPQVNAHWAARLMASNKRALLAAGHHADDAELAAAHNCGVGHVIRGTIPRVTSTLYVPAVLHAMRRYLP